MLRLHLRLQASPSKFRSERAIRRIIDDAPISLVAPISIDIAPHLTAHRGRLLSGDDRGKPVHAGSFLRERRIVLESDLLKDLALLRWILVHELMHFAWMRLPRVHRAAYVDLLEKEWRSRAAGAMGESEFVAKEKWRAQLKSESLWKDFVCESFCDTVAYLYSNLRKSGRKTVPKTGTVLNFGRAESHANQLVKTGTVLESGMALRWVVRRARWFQEHCPRDGWRC